jgi:8-oxo-dGTP diphosphatase
MIETAVCYLLRGSEPGEVLLGRNKRGLGVGKVGGLGGKVEPGETAEQAAVRELQEEVGLRIDPADLTPRGRVTYRFPARPAWDLAMTLFVTRRWVGDPDESDEVTPGWYALDALPYEGMWADARHWLARVLAGEPIRAHFVYGPDNETVASGDVQTGWVGG